MERKAWWKSKTVWANIMVMLITITGIIAGVIPPEYIPHLTIMTAILNLILRLVTDQAIGWSDFRGVLDAFPKLGEEKPK